MSRLLLGSALGYRHNSYIMGEFTSWNDTLENRIIQLNLDGTKDTSFNNTIGFSGGGVFGLLQQPDGKILVWGDFTSYKGAGNAYFLRLNSDGTLDTTFTLSGSIAGVKSVILMPDNKILVGGTFASIGGGNTSAYLVLLNANGSTHTTFNTTNHFNYHVTSLFLQPDGKILVGGSFTTFGGNSQVRLIRLNSDFTKDTSFNVGTGMGDWIGQFGMFSDGKILAMCYQPLPYNGGSAAYLHKINTDGSEDTSFITTTPQFNNKLNGFYIYPNDKIFIWGNFSAYKGVTSYFRIKLNADGTKDTSFSTTGNPGDSLNSCIILSSGKIIILGNFINYTVSPNIYQYNRIARLNEDGTLDLSFDVGTGFQDNSPTTSIYTASGKLLIGGHFTNYRPANVKLAKINYIGDVDTSFNVGKSFNNAALNDLKVQADGKILIGGNFYIFNGIYNVYNILRLNTNGSLDSTFSLYLNGSVNNVLIQPDTKIVLAGGFTAPLRMQRYNQDGTLDSSWDSTNIANSGIAGATLCSNGKFIIWGTFTLVRGESYPTVARLNSDGTLDTTFIPQVAGAVPYNITEQSDGKIIITGTFNTWNGENKSKICRLNTDGTNDSSFNIGTGFNGYVALGAVSIDAYDKIVLGGAFTTYNGGTANYLIRLNSDGSKDTSFNPPNFGLVYMVKCIGNIVMVGHGQVTINGKIVNGLSRLNYDGSYNNSLYQTTNQRVTHLINI